jgi:WD40 repeat protein
MPDRFDIVEMQGILAFLPTSHALINQHLFDRSATMRVLTSTTNPNGWRVLLVSAVILLIMALAACGGDDDAAPEPTATPEPEAETEFVPELLFSREAVDDGTVDSVAFSPDGQIVAAGLFPEVQLWSVPDGDLIQATECRHSVEDVQFSPDGEAVGVGVSLGGVQLISVDDGSELLDLHRGYNNRLAFSPDGELVATGNRDGSVWLWEIDTGELIAEWDSPEGEWLTAVAYSPNGDTVAAGYWDGSVYLWDIESGDLNQALENPNEYGYATRIAFSPDGELLAVAGAQQEFDDVVRIWNTSDGTIAGEIMRDSSTYSTAISPDGALIAVGDTDGISIWDAETLDLIFELESDVDPEQSDWITDLAFSPDSTMLFAGHWNGTIDLWQVQPGS